MRDHWDAILASTPLNSTAAKVTGKGTGFAPAVTFLERVWDAPPTLARINNTHRANPSFVDLTGERIGRLTVLGLAAGESGLWACRCACGRIVGRRAKGLKEKSSEAMCNACDYTRKLRENGASDKARSRAESDKARKW